VEVPELEAPAVKNPQVLVGQAVVLVVEPLKQAQAEFLGKVIVGLRHILVRSILVVEEGVQEQQELILAKTQETLAMAAEV
jgi:hypothetical protein